MPEKKDIREIKFSREALGYHKKEVDDYLRWLADVFRQFEEEQQRIHAQLYEKDTQIAELKEKIADATERLYKHRQTIQELTEELEIEKENVQQEHQLVRELREKLANPPEQKDNTPESERLHSLLACAEETNSALEAKLRQAEEKLAFREQQLYQVRSELAMQKSILKQKSKKKILTFAPLSETEIKKLSE